MGWSGLHATMGWSIGIVWVVLAIVAIGLLVALAMANARNGRPGRTSPEDILKERLARGEIGPEEYERLRRELRR